MKRRVTLGLALFIGLVWLVTADAAGPPGLVITELMVNPPGEDQFEEWIEIANTGPTDANIGGFAIGDEETVGQSEGMVRFPNGTIIAAGQVMVIAQDGPTFARRFGFEPDFEIKNGSGSVPDMVPALDLATGEIGLANGGDELFLLDPDGERVDAMSYGDSSRVLNPPAPAVGRGISLVRSPANCDTDNAFDWQPGDPPSPGIITIDPVCGSVEPLGDVLPIGDVQGDGPVSPFLDQVVTVRGIVVGVQADRNVSGVLFHTIYLQNTAAQADGLPQTSDGLPVFLAATRPGVRPGDEVEVTGRVTEFFGLTELSQEGLTIQTLSRDNPLPAGVKLDLVPGGTFPGEPLEGMGAFLEEAVVLGPKFSTAGGCGFAVATVESGVTRIIRHDIEGDISAVLPVMHVDESACDRLPDVKVGDRVLGLAGPVTYNFDLFRLVNQDPERLAIEPAELSAIPPPLRAGPGQITLTSVNVENLFDEFDDTGDEAEPKPSPDEIDLKLEKISYLIGETLGCPTLVGIQEVENRRLLGQLVDRLADRCEFNYFISHAESLDGRGIDVALLSDLRLTDVTSMELRPACVDFPTSGGGGACPAGQFQLFSRPPLVVALTIGEQELIVLVNHFKSKRGGEAETQPEREGQARYVVELVEEIRAAGPDKIVVIGDFNDFADSIPLEILTKEGDLENVLRRAPAEEQYSFNFGGVAQLIDGILLSGPLADAFEDVRFYHVNADYPDVWGERMSEDLMPYKSTDHDPAVVLLNLGSEQAVETPEIVTTPSPSLSAGAEPPPAEPPPAEPPTKDSSNGRIWVIVGAIFTALAAAAVYLWRQFR